ncbi:class I SAM-dependent methyltransferase [Rickettsiales bacterium]|nr:class I SAM-dependent methyltransferase [Rickettsiales bacterium]
MNILLNNKHHLKNIGCIEDKKIKNWSSVFDIVEDTEFFLLQIQKGSKISYGDFSKRIWSSLNHLHNITQGLSPKSLKERQSFFRGSLFHLLNKSLVLSRALTKPYGYPGDFIMLQTLYNKNPISDNRLGQYFDQFFIDDDLSQAVINRVEALGDRVVRFIEESKKDVIHILDIASGSGFEFQKIVKNKLNKKVVYHCFDQEVSSLSYISQNFIGKNENLDIRLYKEDIRTFFRNWKNDFQFDFIYNIGLADYLPDRILSSLIKESLNHLNKNGVFVLAHKDYNLFPYHHPSWLYDWNFIHRDLESYKDLLKETTSLEFDIWFESEKKIIYFSEFLK